MIKIRVTFFPLRELTVSFSLSEKIIGFCQVFKNLKLFKSSAKYLFVAILSLFI